MTKAKVPTRGVVPLGFRRKLYTTASGKQVPDGLEPDPDEAAGVRRIFERAADGQSLSEIAAALEAGTGDRWTRYTVRNILRNRLYLQEDTRIIDRGLWQRAHAQLRSRRPKWRGGFDG